jgi:hypothetical protein
MSKIIGRQHFTSFSRKIQAAATVWVLFALACSRLAAQNAEKAGDLTPDEIIPPTENSNQLTVKFTLPAPDAVSSFEVLADGKPIDKNKINFTPAEKLQDLRCAVLFLVDKALANTPNAGKGTKEKPPNLEEAVRGALNQLTSSTNANFQFGIATYSATNVVVLAAIQANNQSFLQQAISPNHLKFENSGAELLYHGAKEAIVNTPLGKFQADRKFLVIISDGISKDTADSEADVVKAARDAKVHICTIGFPKSAADVAQLEKLSRLSDQTAGISWSAEGRDLNLHGWDRNLFKYMLSGGRGDVNLAGRSGPLNLEFRVKTNAGQLLNFAYRTEPVASASPSSTPASTPSPSATPEKSPTPAGLFSTGWLGEIKTAAKEHLTIIIGAIVALALGILFLWLLASRAGKKQPRAEPESDVTAIPQQAPLPQPDDTQIPEKIAPVFAWLISLDADSTRHPITKTAVRIGRKADNDLVMKNDSVSSHHAEILKRGDDFMIADLGASNGVFVSGRRVEKSPLANGDIIELGEVRLRFTLNQSDN